MCSRIRLVGCGRSQRVAQPVEVDVCFPRYENLQGSCFTGIIRVIHFKMICKQAKNKTNFNKPSHHRTSGRLPEQLGRILEWKNVMQNYPTPFDMTIRVRKGDLPPTSKPIFKPIRKSDYFCGHF